MKLKLLLEKENTFTCPDNCKYLSPPEKHPDTTCHWCKAFNIRLFHLGEHPKLWRCAECLYITQTARKQDGEVEVELNVKKVAKILYEETGIRDEDSRSCIKIAQVLNSRLGECLVRKR